MSCSSPTATSTATSLARRPDPDDASVIASPRIRAAQRSFVGPATTSRLAARTFALAGPQRSFIGPATTSRLAAAPQRSSAGPATASRLAVLAGLLIVAPACQVTYTIGGSDSAGASDSDDHSSDDRGDSEHDSVGSASDSESGSDTCPDGPTSCEEPTCPDGQILCGSDCVAADSCCLAACDPVRERCDGGECRCRDGLVLCGGTCVDTRSDPRHCGECGNDCGDQGVCNASTCLKACGDGRVACDGACVELASDPLHCDGCGNACAGDEVCLAGDCRPYTYAGECLTCPCPDACVGDLDVCCDSAYLGAAVCIDGSCD